MAKRSTKKARSVTLQLLPPSLFPTAGDVRDFTESRALTAMLHALEAASCPGENTPPELVEFARRKGWMLAWDVRELLAAASLPKETPIESGEAVTDEPGRAQILGVFALVTAMDDRPEAAVELHRLAGPGGRELTVEAA